MRSPLLDKHMMNGFWTVDRVLAELKSRFCIEASHMHLKLVLSQNRRPTQYLAMAIRAIVAPTVKVTDLFPEYLNSSKANLDIDRLVRSAPKVRVRRRNSESIHSQA